MRLENACLKGRFFRYTLDNGTKVKIYATDSKKENDMLDYFELEMTVLQAYMFGTVYEGHVITDYKGHQNEKEVH